jgi:phosphoribosylanthranilate isomerase
MNEIKIKICGLRRTEDAEYVNEFEEIKYVGFVFAKSKRQIDIQTAKEIKKNLRPDIKTVGVFADQSIEDIQHIADEVGLDICQLHSDESNEDCGKIRQTVWKAIAVKDGDSLAKAEQYTNATAFVLDAYNAKERGGTGKTFNWEVATAFAKKYNTILAGGIGSENIVKAYNTVHPQVIDLSSSVEENGFKSYNKIKELIQTIRKEEQNEIQ